MKPDAMKKISNLKLVALLLLIYLRIPALHAQQWVEANNGTIGADISCFVTTDSKIYAGSDASGVFVSDNDQIHWSSLNSGLSSSFVRALFSYAGNLYAGTYGSGVFISHDNGNSWSKSDSGFLQSAVYTNTFAAFDTFLYVGNDDGGYYSTDSGKHWKPFWYLGTQEVKAFAIDGAVLYAGSSYGVHVSMDSGATWPYSNNGLPEEGIIWQMAVSGNRVLCNLDQYGIYATTDSGANWVASFSGIPANANVKSLFADGNTVYAGTDSYGIYRSTDNGVTWSDFNFGQSLSTVTAICKSNGTIFIGSNIDGVLRLEETSNAVAPVSSSSLHLYPNPAIDKILVQDKNGIKKIKIVDITGRTVMETLVNEVTSQEISVKDLTPGIYTAIVDGTAMKFEKY